MQLTLGHLLWTGQSSEKKIDVQKDLFHIVNMSWTVEQTQGGYAEESSTRIHAIDDCFIQEPGLQNKETT